jgi:hypothetical protein
MFVHFNVQRKPLFCDENGDPNLDALLEEGMTAFVLRRGDNDNLMGRWDPECSVIRHSWK